ncbi:hypothetical protein BSBH6_00162 [Bacillus subtilis]|nr:hypothetical protein BSBH6_00162 [Bacillus subtilis]RPK26525.1 hypothetical protein BH5_00160 [Bacillus subtilis]
MKKINKKAHTAMWTYKKQKQFHFKWNSQQNQIEEGVSYESITGL